MYYPSTDCINCMRWCRPSGNIRSICRIGQFHQIEQFGSTCPPQLSSWLFILRISRQFITIKLSLSLIQILCCIISLPFILPTSTRFSASKSATSANHPTFEPGILSLLDLPPILNPRCHRILQVQTLNHDVQRSLSVRTNSLMNLSSCTARKSREKTTPRGTEEPPLKLKNWPIWFL